MVQILFLISKWLFILYLVEGQEGRASNCDEQLMPEIYFWKVTSLMPGSEGKVQTGTFLIIK